MPLSFITLNKRKNENNLVLCLLNAEVVPQPVMINSTFGDTSVMSVLKQAGRINSVNSIDPSTRIKAISLTFVNEEYFGCLINVSIFRSNGSFSSSFENNVICHNENFEYQNMKNDAMQLINNNTYSSHSNFFRWRSGWITMSCCQYILFRNYCSTTIVVILSGSFVWLISDSSLKKSI